MVNKEQELTFEKITNLLGLYFSRVLGIKVLAKDPVPPVIRIVELDNIIETSPSKLFTDIYVCLRTFPSTISKI